MTTPAAPGDEEKNVFLPEISNGAGSQTSRIFCWSLLKSRSARCLGFLVMLAIVFEAGWSAHRMTTANDAMELRTSKLVQSAREGWLVHDEYPSFPGCAAARRDDKPIRNTSMNAVASEAKRPLILVVNRDSKTERLRSITSQMALQKLFGWQRVSATEKMSPSGDLKHPDQILLDLYTPEMQDVMTFLSERNMSVQLESVAQMATANSRNWAVSWLRWYWLDPVRLFQYLTPHHLLQNPWQNMASHSVAIQVSQIRTLLLGTAHLLGYNNTARSVHTLSGSYLITLEDDAVLCDGFETAAMKIAATFPDADLIWLEQRTFSAALATGAPMCCCAGLLYRAEAAPRFARALMPTSPEWTRFQSFMVAQDRPPYYDFFLSYLCEEEDFCCSVRSIVRDESAGPWPEPGTCPAQFLTVP